MYEEAMFFLAKRTHNALSAPMAYGLRKHESSGISAAVLHDCCNKDRYVYVQITCRASLTAIERNVTDDD